MNQFPDFLPSRLLTFEGLDFCGIFWIIKRIADESVGGIFHRRHDVTDLTHVENVDRPLVRREHAYLLQIHLKEMELQFEIMELNYGIE